MNILGQTPIILLADPEEYLKCSYLSGTGLRNYLGSLFI